MIQFNRPQALALFNITHQEAGEDVIVEPVNQNNYGTIAVAVHTMGEWRNYELPKVGGFVLLTERSVPINE